MISARSIASSAASAFLPRRPITIAPTASAVASSPGLAVPPRAFQSPAILSVCGRRQQAAIGSKPRVRLSLRFVRVAKKPSTALSQEADVGVKWNVHRGWRRKPRPAPRKSTLPRSTRRRSERGSFDLAGVMLAAAHQRREFTPLGFAQFDMAAYVHPGLLANREAQTNQAMNQLFGTCPRLPRSPTSKVSTWPSSTPPRAHRFHQEYGTILGVIGALPIPVRRVSPTRWKKTGKRHGSARSQSLEGCWLGGRGRPGSVEVRTPDCERLAGVRIPSIGGTGPLEARESTGLRISLLPPVVESIKLFSVTR